MRQNAMIGTRQYGRSKSPISGVPVFPDRCRSFPLLRAPVLGVVRASGAYSCAYARLRIGSRAVPGSAQTRRLVGSGFPGVQADLPVIQAQYAGDAVGTPSVSVVGLSVP